MTYKTPKSLTIVMADDDEDDCLLIKDAFRECGIADGLRFVEDGEVLMDYLSRRCKYLDATGSPCPDLVLLDLNMPLMDGRQALQEMKSDPAFRSIPVVIFTTSEEPGDIRFCYDTGASSFMVKPRDFSQLVEAVKSLCSYWFDWMSLPPKNEGC